MRQIPIPKQLQIAEDYPGLINCINNTIQSNALNRILICTGEFTYNFLVKKLIDDLAGKIQIDLKIVSDNDIKQITELEENKIYSQIYEIVASCGIDSTIIAKTNSAVLGIGGGKVLDFAKYLAAKTQTRFISVPSLISHDGICSPVAVLNGRSLGATMPLSLIVPLYLIEQGSLEHIRAGIGDLVANLSAIEDWKLAAQQGETQIEDFAIMLSRQASMSVLQILENQTLNYKTIPEEIQETILKDKFLLKALIESLALSGIAMSIAGNSRPCSGAEHLISHAVDQIHGHGNKAMHGTQVLVASLYLEQIRAFDLIDPSLKIKSETKVQHILKKLGFPTKFSDININDAELKKILELAPQTRQGRYTILNLQRSKNPLQD